MGFSTDAIHAGQHPDPSTGAVIVPIYQTSTYVQQGLGDHKGYEYARTQNPTREALEANVAALERGIHGVCFASGLAAISTILHLVKAGEHVVASANMYGGTYRLMEKVLRDHGLLFDYADTSDLDAVRAALRKETKLLFVETPTNPMMVVSDLAALAGIAHDAGVLVAVDNTFMTPYFQRPLEMGADLVVHSSTKYLNGHSDMVGGVVVTRRDDLAERLRFLQNAVGAVPGPFDCWLALRGTKTLAVRMERHDRNARQIAAALTEHRNVRRVYYPGLADHPGRAVMERQCSGFGGMISFDVGSLEAAKSVLGGTRLFSLAESLGGVESLISHPATMTHASVPAEERRKMGLGDGLVRISVGIEDVEDLWADLDGALRRI